MKRQRGGFKVGESNQIESASVICALGGLTGGLKVAESRDGFLSVDEIVMWVGGRSEIYILQDAGYSLLQMRMGTVELSEYVLVTDTGRPAILQTGRSGWTDWPESRFKRFHSRTLVGAVVRGLAAGWSCDAEDVWSASSFSTDGKELDRPIGTRTDGGEVVTHTVDILRQLTHSKPSRKRRMR